MVERGVETVSISDHVFSKRIRKAKSNRQNSRSFSTQIRLNAALVSILSRFTSNVNDGLHLRAQSIEESFRLPLDSLSKVPSPSNCNLSAVVLSRLGLVFKIPFATVIAL